MKLEFFWEIFEKYKSNLMKIHAVRAELFNAAARIDRQSYWSQELVFAILQTYINALHCAHKVNLSVLYDSSTKNNYLPTQHQNQLFCNMHAEVFWDRNLFLNNILIKSCFKGLMKLDMNNMPLQATEPWCFSIHHHQ